MLGGFGQDAFMMMTDKFKQVVSDPVLSKTSLLPAGLAANNISDDDLKRLGTDSSVSKVYGNGEYTVFRIVKE